MKRYIIFFMVALSLTFISASATIINVPDDYGTIQEGIEASTDGDTVLVQPGTYVENINFNGHNIALGSLFLTTGDTTYISTTIIDGNSSGRVVTIEGDSTTLITGFTIQNGHSGGGGGIHCISSPTISNNIIRNNSASNDGGGISCSWNSSPTITDNFIIENEANDAGGGIYCYSNSTPKIINNFISDNWSHHDTGGGIFCKEYSCPTINGNTIQDNEGGGIYCYDNTNPLVINNHIIGNYIHGSGGGIKCSENSNALISNNIFIGNLATGYGGGLYCRYSDPLIVNNTFYGNSAESRGGAISCSNSNPLILNTICWYDSAEIENEIHLYNSSPIVTYCDIQGGWPEGEGNIDLLPLFRDPVNGDYHLMSVVCGDSSDSPCIDAGDPTIFDSMLGCDWGLGELRSDMGAYGGEGIPTDVNEEQLPEIPMQFLLSQNYPNPFNAQTVISFALPEPSQVTIEIYDILGRRVETCLDDYREAGEHQIIWDASDLSSGIYFYRIQIDYYGQTNKMILLR